MISELCVCDSGSKVASGVFLLFVLSTPSGPEYVIWFTAEHMTTATWKFFEKPALACNMLCKAV